MVALILLCSAATGWSAEFHLYSWQVRAQVSVKSLTCTSFAQAREAAEVLAALHSLDRLPGLDADFVMVDTPAAPLLTWVLRSDEPFQAHEYVRIEDKADKSAP